MYEFKSHYFNFSSEVERVQKKIYLSPSTVTLMKFYLKLLAATLPVYETVNIQYSCHLKVCIIK